MISYTKLNFVTNVGLSWPIFFIFILHQLISSNSRCMLSVIPTSWLLALTHHAVKSLKLMFEVHIKWNTTVRRSGIFPLLHHLLLLHTNHTTSNALLNQHHPNDKGKHQYHLSPRYCNTSWSFLWHQEIYPTRGVMLLAAVIPLLRFFIMNISMCFLENVKINMLFLFLYFHCNTFFLQSMQDPHGHPWGIECWSFVHDRRGTSTNVLLHPYFQDVRSSSFTASVLLCCFTGGLVHFSSCDTPAVTHNGIIPRYRTGQLTYFRRLSTSNLFALNSLSVIIPKSGPSYA